MPIYYHTPDKKEYNFFPNHVGFMHFKVKAANTVSIVLTNGPELKDPMYTILIGSNQNTQSQISKKGVDGPNLVEVPSPSILNSNEHRGFWVEWGNSRVSVGKQGETVPFMTCTDSQIIQIKYFGFCTFQGATGDWIFELKQCGCPSQPRPTGPGSCWVRRDNGDVPDNAFVACDRGEPVYVIRGYFLIPGRVPEGGKATISWCNEEINIQEYEVLVDYTGKWVKNTAPNIPAGAVVVGADFEGRSLYVGRFTLKGVLYMGAVKATKGLYAFVDGKHHFFKDYEILVNPD